MEYAAVFLGGLGLGCFYFGGLWLTTQALARTATANLQQRSPLSPVLTMLVSFMVRMGVTLAGLYWLMQGNWVRALAALLGILVARFMIKNRVGSMARKEVPE